MAKTRKALHAVARKNRDKQRIGLVFGQHLKFFSHSLFFWTSKFTPSRP